MAIDIVYNYVNGNDTEWVQKRNAYAMDNNNTACRFRDNQELMYSLRSIDMYAPWIRKVFIVTDSKIPDWLNTDNDRVVIVGHEQIMPAELLPCYNSNIIEWHMDNIEGVSDMFFGAPVSEDFFVKDGKPVIRMVISDIEHKTHYGNVVYNAREMFYKKYGIKYNLIPTHTIDVYSREGWKKCKEEFAADYEKLLPHRLRTNDDVNRVLFHYYLIANNMCELKKYHEAKFYKYINRVKQLIAPEKYLDYMICNIDTFYNSETSRKLFMKNPKLVCMNDTERTTDEMLELYKSVMSKKFPDKSSFER